ncbi:MAG: gliding motility lipoprotein GldH [Tannerellaceae bacterium]|jgi:gliding motility-associated lipoprotein GldH|nr:gliding motility lipoprotein GldH [Tannerellaceae bacterium]
MGNLSQRLICKAKGSVVFFMCLFLFSCGKNQTVYNQYQTIEHSTWEKNKEYYFTFQIDDTTIPYHITLEIRNNNLYPYQNLWLFLDEESPAGLMVRDTMEYMLADDFGKWLGSGISLFQTSFPIKTNYLFSKTGRYTFGFRQGMRSDTLRGIQEIGLRIEKAGS